MIIGVISDSHKDRMNALPHIVAELERRGAQAIIHCGDIEPQHLNPKLFGNLPVICALIEEQVGRREFETPPKNWRFTTPGNKNRICDIGGIRVYVGHKRAFEFLTGSEAKLIETLNAIRRDHDCVRWLFSGHTHHQIYKQSHIITFVNPGAIEDSFDGYEYAVVDTETDKVVFSRIPKTKPVKKPLFVGVISDSFDVAEIDTDFWKKLAEELKQNNVNHVIHCGNIALGDIGRPELSDFQVFYNLRPDQKNLSQPKNWHLILQDDPVVEINGYRFYVNLDLGASLLDQSEFGMHKLCLKLRRKHPEIGFVLCGFTNDAFLEEGEQVRIINPGDVVKDRNFAIVRLPVTEITFAHVPVEPLPPIESEEPKSRERS